jgi:hypothetical protein
MKGKYQYIKQGKGSYNLGLMLLMLIFLNCPIYGQITRKGNNVVMSIQNYTKVREKVYLCDTLLSVKDSIILHKDSVILEKNKKIEEYKVTILQKDTTIKLLKEVILTEKPTKKWYECKEVYWIAGISFIFGLLISR